MWGILPNPYFNYGVLYKMDVKLVTVKSSYEKQQIKDIIKNYHSYVPSYKSVGRRIDWLIYYNNAVIGMIGIGSATYPPCKDVLSKLNITKEEYKCIFNNIANNWRFCLKERIPNLGTQVLKQLRQQAPIEWKNKYGEELFYIITFVAGGNVGTVYKADNWELIGTTSGLPEHKSVSMKWDGGYGVSNKFVKPTGENKKLIFFKQIKKTVPKIITNPYPYKYKRK